MGEALDGYAVDIVVTWVDGADPAWRAQKAEWLAKENPEAVADWNTGDLRYRDWGLLPYWFRCIENNAPWVRTVHFVTWGHLPEWLDTSNPKLHIVKHEDFIPAKYLPTFNSHTIELNMHRIPGLAERFVYFNDDMYLLKKADKDNFFRDGLPRDFTGLDVRTLSRALTDYRPYNAMVINDHFSKNDVIRANRWLWFNPVYGPKCLMKTLLLMPFGRFAGFQTDHLPINFLKHTFDEVWEAEPDMLDRSCAQRFRGEVAVSPWLMRDWQRVKGEFVPIKPQLGATFNCGTKPEGLNDGNVRMATVAEVVARIEHPSGLGTICLNDYCESDGESEEWGKALREAFGRRFPDKSRFER